MDRYRLLSSLGVGGAGQVVLVEDRLRPGSRLALKELLDATPEKSAELHREFATLATLRHPSLVEVLELEVDPETGRSQLIMEYVDGENVVDAIRHEGTGSLLPVAAELLRALAFLHDFGLVHRDLKPGNILVRAVPKAGHRVVVLDFGLAAERRTDPNERAEGMAGTLPYMAPELFDGAVPTKRTDLYAIGVVIFEAVHGKTPIVLKGNDINGFIAAAREGRRARPAPPAGLPAGLGRWLDEMLAPEAADRPSSATDALARLNEACDGNFPLETTDDRAARLGSGQPVGRDQELTALREALAPSDKPRVIWLCGDAGSGKSRILRSLASAAIGSNGRVHAPPGLLPATADAFVDRVRADAAAAPTLVLLDEMERADNAVATFVDRIAREPREAPVRVVIAGRPGELTHPKLRKLLADTGVVPSLARVDLAPMGEAGLKAMIDRASAGRSSAQARVRWLLENSEGNAGAAEALIVEGVWEKRGKIPVATALLQSIRRRLLALSPEARAWLEALAVLGDDTPESLVGELAGLEDLAGAARDEAVAAGLARHVAGSVSPDSRRAADAVISAASPERLRELHALAATHFATLERDTFGVISWRLARLWRGAGDTERALAASLDSASAAEIAKQWEEAAVRLRFALSLLARRDPRRAELWMRRAEALRQAMLHREAVKAFGWAARWATDPEQKLEARARRAKALCWRGRHLQAESAARSLVSDARASDSARNEGRAWEVICIVAQQRFDTAVALDAGQQAVRLLDSDSSADTVAALHALCGVEHLIGMPEVDSHFDRAMRLCDSLDIPYLRMTLLLGRALAEERAGRLDSAAAALKSAESASRDPRSSAWVRWVQHFASRLHATRGAFDTAATLAHRTEELALYLNDPNGWGSAISLAAGAMIDAGRSTAARQYLATRLANSMPQVPPIWTSDLRVLLATSLDGGTPRTDLTEALDCLRRASMTFAAFAIAFELEEAVREPRSAKTERLVAEARSVLNQTKEPVITAQRLDLILGVGRILNARAEFAEAAHILSSASAPEGCPAEPSRYGKIRFLLADVEAQLGQSGASDASRADGVRLLRLAAERIDDADWRRDFLEQDSIRSLLASASNAPETKRIEALYDMIRALNSETDPEALLAASLEMSLNAVGAERGMILLSGPTSSEFSVRLAKNLEKETVADAEAFSRRIAQQAGLGESVLALDAGQDDRFKEFKSVSLFRIRSLMCVPLRSRGRIIGTVYLDSRRQGRPFTREDLRFVEAFADHAALALENARRRAELEAENKRLKAVAGERASYANIVGRSPAMQRVFDLLERIASSETTVLVQGESGTGKELVARAIHFNGPRKDKAFLSENCAAIAETLLESELFGHVKGAFTGADKDRAGVFEQAHGGTLFLDEVGDMSQAMQARLLRVLQDGELRRVGGDRSIKVDVRVIAATNKDLQIEVAAGRFREDLYYRLAVIPVNLPPLRERVGDVPFIASHLLEQIAGARSRPKPHVDGAVFDAMERYAWPGNVRQLENLLRRMALLAGDGPIDRSVIDSDSELARMLFGKESAAGPMLSLEKTEQEQIRRALDAAAGNRDRAARLLGISRATIYRKMREYDLR